MSNSKKKPSAIIFSLLLLALIATGLSFYLLQEKPGEHSAQSEPGQVMRAPDRKEVVQPPAGLDEDAIHPGYNPDFKDSAFVQTRWIGRASDIVDQNLPDYATSAEIDGAFFHRGFKGKAAICGKVKFYRDEELAMDYQRFVFPGGYIIHYENEVKNFQIYWDKVCIEKNNEN